MAQNVNERRKEKKLHTRNLFDCVLCMTLNSGNPGRQEALVIVMSFSIHSAWLLLPPPWERIFIPNSVRERVDAVKRNGRGINDRLFRRHIRETITNAGHSHMNRLTILFWYSCVRFAWNSNGNRIQYFARIKRHHWRKRTNKQTKSQSEFLH